MMKRNYFNYKLLLNNINLIVLLKLYFYKYFYIHLYINIIIVFFKRKFYNNLINKN